MGFVPPAVAASSPTNGTGADSPGKNPLTVGSVTFTSRECPQNLPIGAGEQVIVEKRITGGTKIVQVFGAFYKNVRFSGTLWENAVARANALDAMRQAGTTVVISWLTYRFNGIVVDFVPTYRNAYYCPFELELNITGPYAPSSTSSSATSLQATVATANANVVTALASVNAVDPTAASYINPQLLTNLNASLQAASPLSQSLGTPAAAAVIGDVNTALTAVNSYLATITSLSPGYVPAVSMLNSLALIARNVQQGQGTAATQQVGGTFFETAVLAYGSIDRGIALADANGAASLILPAALAATIALPPLTAASAT